MHFLQEESSLGCHLTQLECMYVSILHLQVGTHFPLQQLLLAAHCPKRLTGEQSVSCIVSQSFSGLILDR